MNPEQRKLNAMPPGGAAMSDMDRAIEKAASRAFMLIPSLRPGIHGHVVTTILRDFAIQQRRDGWSEAADLVAEPHKGRADDGFDHYGIRTERDRRYPTKGHAEDAE